MLCWSDTAWSFLLSPGAIFSERFELILRSWMRVVCCVTATFFLPFSNVTCAAKLNRLSTRWKAHYTSAVKQHFKLLPPTREKDEREKRVSWIFSGWMSIRRFSFFASPPPPPTSVYGMRMLYNIRARRKSFSSSRLKWRLIYIIMKSRERLGAYASVCTAFGWRIKTFSTLFAFRQKLHNTNFCFLFWWF